MFSGGSGEGQMVGGLTIAGCVGQEKEEIGNHSAGKTLMTSHVMWL